DRQDRRQIMEAHLAGAFVISAAQFSSVLRTTVFTIMIACTEHGKTSLMKNNSGQKMKVNNRDFQTLRWIVSKQHRTTARELHKANIHERAATAKTLITDTLIEYKVYHPLQPACSLTNTRAQQEL
uniref:Uncharacterized protein n=1 Tax=Sinocyclocheilus rhinocerous TaxID=307959 RepID=A0A673KEU5_9TELE